MHQGTVIQSTLPDSHAPADTSIHIRVSFTFAVMSAVLKQGPIFKHMDKARWSDAWFILRRTSTGPQIQLFKDSSAKKSLGDAIDIATNAPVVRFGKTSKTFEKAPECGKDVRLCEEAFIAIIHEKAQKKGAATMETVWLCALSTADMFELLRLMASSMHTSDHEAPSPADDDETAIGSDCVPTPFVPVNDWERFWVNPPKPEAPALVAPSPGKLKKAKSVDALTNAKVDQKNGKQRTATVTMDDSKLEDPKRRDSTTSVLSNESNVSSVAVAVKKGKNDKKKEPKTKEKPDKKKNKEKEVKAAEVVIELKKAEELAEEKPKKEKPKVAPKPKSAKGRERSISSSSLSSVEEKPKVELCVVPGNKNKKDKKLPNGEEKKPELVHTEAQTDSEHSNSPPHRAAINPPPAGYEAVVGQLKSKDAAKANDAKPAAPPVPPPKKQQPILPPPKSSLPNSEDGVSSEDEASFEDALERGQSIMQKPTKNNKNREYSVSQYEVNDLEEKMAKHTVVYDQNGHDVERHSVEIASSRH